jgi:hypothetical protein
MPDDRGTANVERPFQPEIPRSHFAQGMVPSERYPMDLHLGRFSEGMEAIADSPRRSAGRPGVQTSPSGRDRLGARLSPSRSVLLSPPTNEMGPGQRANASPEPRW